MSSLGYYSAFWEIGLHIVRLSFEGIAPRHIVNTMLLLESLCINYLSTVENDSQRMDLQLCNGKLLLYLM